MSNENQVGTVPVDGRDVPVVKLDELEADAADYTLSANDVIGNKQWSLKFPVGMSTADALEVMAVNLAHGFRTIPR